MVHDFTLIYALDSGMGSQEDVLRQVAGSDCADATVGWGRPGHVGLAFSRDASDRYAALHSQTYGQAIDAEKLIPHMLEAFMVGDRGFRGRRPDKSGSTLPKLG
nr:DUF2274 domain-containing protein [Pigmentiphaga sp.]